MVVKKPTDQRGQFKKIKTRKKDSQALVALCNQMMQALAAQVAKNMQKRYPIRYH